MPPENTPAVQWVPGMRLRVPLGNRLVIGVLLQVKSSSSVPLARCKRAELIDDKSYLDAGLLSLLQWVSHYYHFPIGETISAALPKSVRQGKKITLPESPSSDAIKMSQPHRLTNEQKNAIDVIASSEGFLVYLLEGVTGSGKTEVYMNVALQTLQRGRQVLVLVPEIGLTPQMCERFENRFNVPVLEMHSQIADGKRFKNWASVINQSPCIVVGTRLSVFAPFSKLGLIIIDEEHDSSFKQHAGLRYSARDVAIKRSHDLSIPVVLGSATPSFESMYNVAQKKYIHVKLTERVSQKPMPALQVIDVRQQQLSSGLSPVLVERMKTFLASGQQVMLFLNRRGYAPVMMCHHCGWGVQCQSCDKYMVWHKSTGKLKCHHCDSVVPSVKYCQECGQAELSPVGYGTQRMDESLENLFPSVKVIRVDRDSTQKKNSMREIIEEVKKKQPLILLGTQMLAKGHHFPALGLVAIVNADTGLFSVDFRAQEKLAQLIIQVSGRAGRGEKAGQVILQTHHPEHPLLQTILKKGYAAFVESALQERQVLLLPPYSYWAVLHAEAKVQKDAIAFIDKYRVLLQNTSTVKSCGSLTMNGPVVAPMAKRSGYYRVQLLFRASLRNELRVVLCLLTRNIEKTALERKIKWSLDVDPQEIY